MIPLSMIIVGDLFTIENRGKIQAVFSSIWAISSIVGPVLGSFFVEALTWRWIFFINIPIGIVTVLCMIPYKEKIEFKKTHIDYKGFFLFGISITPIIVIYECKKFYLVHYPWDYRFNCLHIGGEERSTSVLPSIIV